MKTKTTKTLLSLLALALVGVPQASAVSDSFANATDITGSNVESETASLMNYTAEAGEPGHKRNGTAGAQKSAWWRWTATSNGFCTVDTIPTASDQFIRDTILAVYKGESVNALTLVVANDDHGLNPAFAAARSASATFYATQGTTYRIAVDGYVASSINANNDQVRIRVRQMAAVAENRIGVFGNDDEAGIHGSVHLSKTAGHSFTAKLMMAGKAYPFSGVFSLDGYFITSFERKVPVGAAPLPPLTLMLDGALGGSLNIVSITGASGSSFSTVRRFTTAQPSSMNGLYTASIATSGTLTLNVSKLGVVAGAAVLPDGTKTTFGSSLCFAYEATSSHVPTYVSLYTHAGFFLNYLKITEAGAVDVLGSDYSKFLRPAKAGAAFYPNGFNLNPTIKGSTYIPPALGARALGFLDGSAGAGKLSITMQAGEIAQAITENLTLDTKNLIKFVTPLMRKPLLTLNKANGLVTGSILDDAGKKRTLTGVLYRDGMTVKLAGHLTGTTYNPVFSIIP